MARTIEDLRENSHDYNHIIKMYNAAETEEAKEHARECMRNLKAQIDEGGQMYTSIFQLLQEKEERNNDYIVIDSLTDEDKAAELVEALKTYGINEFVFASSWSSAVKVGWAFTQAGCELAGMAMVNSQYTKTWRSDEREQIPGYIFKIA